MSPPGRIGVVGTNTSTQSDESYLRYYSQIAWLRAAVSTIAQGVAQTKWVLYHKKKSGDREEVTDHEITALLNRPNPFQSGHDLLELHQIFDELLGKVFWVKERNHGANELWIAPRHSLKGPNGERAYEDRSGGLPTSNRFLELADIALGLKKSATKKKAAAAAGSAVSFR